jgi:hypothetical protein
VRWLLKIGAGKISKIETDIKIGETQKIGDRTIHFLIKTSILRTDDGDILGGFASPLAMIIGEREEYYVFSFTGQDFNINQLEEMAPPLKDVLSIDKGIHKIKII